MATSSGPGRRDELPSRLTQRVPQAPENSTDYGGGNLVGSEKGSRDISRADTATPEGSDAAKRKDADREAAAKDQPIGSALASAAGRNDAGATAGAGSDLSSGPGTLGATSGGERASAGSSDSNRSSRDHRNSLDD